MNNMNENSNQSQLLRARLDPHIYPVFTKDLLGACMPGTLHGTRYIEANKSVSSLPSEDLHC